MILIALQTYQSHRDEKDRYPIPESPPLISIESLPGIPELFQAKITNSSSLKFHKLTVFNSSPARIDNYCARLQIPEPIITTYSTNSSISTIVQLRPISTELYIEGTGGRTESGLWAGPKSKLNFWYPIPSYSPPPNRDFKMIQGGGLSTGVWDLSIDSMKPGARIEILFATSNQDEATNYTLFASTPLWKLRGEKNEDTNELQFYLRGKYQFPSETKPTERIFLSPIGFNQTNRSMIVQTKTNGLNPVTFFFN